MKIFKWAGLTLILLILGAIPLLFEKDLPKEIVDRKYTNTSSQFLITDKGARIHFRDEGPSSSTAVVLIHGAMASLHTWEPWVNILGTRYRLITLDLPAHGLTGKVPEDAYGPNSFNETIDAIVNELDIEHFVLGGNSMGGGATWRYALRNPDRVQAMILVDSVGPSSWRNKNRASSTDSSNDTPIGFYLLGQTWFRSIARYIDPGLLIEQGLTAAYNKSPVVNEALIDRYYDLIMREGTRSAILRRSRPAKPENGDQPDLSQLSQPTLIMWGAKDSIVPVSFAKRFAQTLPNAESIIYEDLGHIPMEEDPTRSAADVMAFLDRL